MLTITITFLRLQAIPAIVCYYALNDFGTIMQSCLLIRIIIINNLINKVRTLYFVWPLPHYFVYLLSVLVVDTIKYNNSE